VPSTAKVLREFFAERRQLGDAKTLLAEATQRLPGPIAILVQDTQAPHAVRLSSQRGFAPGALDALGVPQGVGEVGGLRFCSAPLAGSSEQVIVVRDRDADLDAISLTAVFLALALERGVEQSPRLQAIGAVATGVAHDFNNVLASILSHLDLAKLQASAVSEDLTSAMDSALRGRDLVRQLLAIGRAQPEPRSAHRLQSLIHQSMSMMRATMPPAVGFRMALDPRAPSVLGDPTQLQQVLVNLVALAANLVRGKGTVELSLQARASGGAELIVSSEGEQLASRDERPLGLSVTRGIVKSHGGTLELEAARAVLWFPGVAEEPEAVQGKQQRIALVDDEPMVARATERLVSQFGYQVTMFSSADQLLRAFAAKPDAFELVLTDQTMPEMTGLELTYALRKRGVQVPVLLVTGLPTEIDTENVSQPFVVLGKPYRSEELASGLAKLLAR
jgi:signal transduction histidine kinase